MQINKPSTLLVQDLIRAHGNNGFIDMSQFSHISNVESIDSDIANTTCTVHLLDQTQHQAIYNRINLGPLFGVVAARLRDGKVDWKNQEHTVTFDNPKVYDELNKLYGVILSPDDAFLDSLSDGAQTLNAKETNPAYYGYTKLEFYEARYTDIPFGMLTGFQVSLFKGDYTIMPMQPYPVDSFMLTSNPDYNPNGDIYGEWVQENPIITSGIEAELLRLPNAYIFELMEYYPGSDHIEVICLNAGSEIYNQGNAELLFGEWKITNKKSPLYNETVKMIQRDEMTTSIKTHMIIFKETGYIASVDNPEYRWKRVK